MAENFDRKKTIFKSILKYEAFRGINFVVI